MATTSVPDVLINFRTQLMARAALAGVAVHLIDFGDLTEHEVIQFTRVQMSGAAFFLWGAGEGSRATREPLVLSGSVFVELAGNDDEGAATALRRAGVLLTEIMQQLRDDPTIWGALVSPRVRGAPLMESALWRTAPADAEGSSAIHVRVDFSIAWNAVT